MGQMFARVCFVFGILIGTGAMAGNLIADPDCPAWSKAGFSLDDQDLARVNKEIKYAANVLTTEKLAQELAGTWDGKFNNGEGG